MKKKLPIPTSTVINIQNSIIKAFGGGKLVTNRRMKIRMLSEFLTSVLEARRQWNKVNKNSGGNFPSRILYSAELSVKCKDRTKTFFSLQGLKTLLPVDTFLGNNQTKYFSKMRK